ncbi:TPA: hypothetical protein I7F36_000858 [Vibrio cholerae]|uniref:hypothetical protein n=2 Tax=Vibrio cholerae TaxID=666 RepID=UPI0000F34C84|nr:hypothetical protein [Vibrio cholerae]EAZ75205.1 conserved hypothetical protein [Vibrio cholerae NCTC 8457]APF80451.1 hypothetical protein ASZ85_02960 [Vibrio cholerae]EGR1017952.1 hypothetical protein [Vibrio cholerae]EGR2015908.1 hypothetical protein [Vibrio cholerae]EGR2444049.1 hypothetical protein [Vibrio cholerae]
MTSISSKIFAYVNQYGEASVQILRNIKQQKRMPFLQGWCINHHAPRTLHHHRILGEFKTVEEAEIYLKENAKHFVVVEPTYPASEQDSLQVCFTGFNKLDKAALKELAANNNMIVRKEVTVYLDILCYGINAGPKKLEKAMEQGVMILNREQFEKMIETGEVPECA